MANHIIKYTDGLRFLSKDGKPCAKKNEPIHELPIHDFINGRMQPSYYTCEYFEETTRVRPIFDFDCKIPIDRIQEDPELVKNIIKKAKNILNDTFEGIFETYFDDQKFQKKNIVMCKADRQIDDNTYKISRRFFIKGVSVQYGGIPYIIEAYKMNERFTEFDLGNELLFDLNIYMKTSRVNCVNCKKSQLQDRVFKIRSKHELIDCVAQYLEGNELAMPDIKIPNKIEVTNPRTYNSTIQDEKLMTIIKGLSPKRAGDYKSWSTGLCVIINTCAESNIDPEPYAIEFSKLNKDKFPGEAEVIKKLADFQYNPEGYKLGTFFMWLQEDNPELCKQLKTKKQVTNITSFKQLIYCENKLRYEEVKAIFETKAAKVLYPICWIIDDPDSGLQVKSKKALKETFENLTYVKKLVVQDDGTEDITRDCFINRWLKDAKIKTFDQLDFLPPPLTCPPTVFNLWRGFEIDKVECNEQGSVDMFLEHVDILAGRKPHDFKYLIKWLAQLVQYPGKIIGIALVFVSKEGAGKNIFLDEFANIIGPQYYFECTDPTNQLFGKHSNGRKNKLLITVDEAKSRDTFANSDLLKNMITSKHFNYEAKGVDPITLRSFNRMVFATNHEKPILVSESDRRYVIFESSSEKCGDLDYFKKFADYMSKIENQKAIMEYLRGVDIEDFNFIKERPISELYKLVKSSCVDLVTKFLNHIWMKNHSETTLVIEGADFLEDFQSFMKTKLHLKDEVVSSWNPTNLGREMTKKINAGYGITKLINYGPSKCKAYEIDMSTLKEYLTKHSIITEDTYMFLRNKQNDDDHDF